MRKIGKLDGYDIYKGYNKKGTWYNIVPIGFAHPKIGYTLKSICKAKSVNLHEVLSLDALIRTK